MRHGRWQGSLVTPGWRGNRPARLRRPRACALNSGNLPRSPLLLVLSGLLQERHSFPTPFVLRLVLYPGAKLVAKNNWKQMLFQHPTVIWGSRWGHQRSGCLLHGATPPQRISIPEPFSTAKFPPNQPALSTSA